jgi:hypothetical protein
MRSFLALIMLCPFASSAWGQDRHDWQSVSGLQAGDRVRVVLKTGPVEGEFQKWTPEDATFGTVTAKREDVIKIERYRRGGSRGKHAAFGALIGFGGGFAIGASVNLCVGLGPCVKRPVGGAVVGGAGAVIGALIGALLPTHSREIIYSSSTRKRTSNRITSVSEGGSIALIP